MEKQNIEKLRLVSDLELMLIYRNEIKNFFIEKEVINILEQNGITRPEYSFDSMFFLNTLYELRKRGIYIDLHEAFEEIKIENSDIVDKIKVYKEQAISMIETQSNIYDNYIGDGKWEYDPDDLTNGEFGKSIRISEIEENYLDITNKYLSKKKGSKY